MFDLTHKDLVNAAFRWCEKNASCGVVFKELVSAVGETPDVIGFGGWGHSVLIECKRSRSDFFAEKKKAHRQPGKSAMGKYRFFCCPTGMIKPTELPFGWGLIYVNASMRATCIINPFKMRHNEQFAYRHRRCRQSEMAVMYSALRRLHLRGLTKEIYNAPIEVG